jgi:hypothetical protein
MWYVCMWYTDERTLQHQPLITNFPTLHIVLYYRHPVSNFNLDKTFNLLLQDRVLPIVSKETRQIRSKSLWSWYITSRNNCTKLVKVPSKPTRVQDKKMTFLAVCDAVVLIKRLHRGWGRIDSAFWSLNLCNTWIRLLPFNSHIRLCRNSSG